LRIGIDARPLTLPSNGIGRYTREIVSRLAASHHELFLYTHQPIELQDDRITFRCGNLDRPLFASAFAQYRFPRWAYIDSVEVFWSPRHHLPLFSSAPGVVTIHDLVWRKAPDSMIGLGRLLEALLMPPSLRKAQAIIAVSEATREDLVEYLPAVTDRISVIPEAAFTPTEEPQLNPQRSNEILFVGTFEPRKNLPGILKAFALLIEQGITSHRLILAGNPGWKENVAGLIAHLGLEGHVTLFGQANQVELEKLYQNCDFTVQPAFYEGFGLPVLEAMTYGKPVITSNLSSMPEVAGDAALLVDPNSPEEIAEAMKRLITEPDLYQTLASRTRAQAAKFSWDRAAAETLRVLESVVENAG